MKTEQTENCSRATFWLPVVKTMVNVGRYPVPFWLPVVKRVMNVGRYPVPFWLPCPEE